MDFEEQYSKAHELVEQTLQESLLDMGPHQELLQAMRYSLLAGGKRIRPVLVLKFCEAMCGSMEPALDYAVGIEMLHTYSLIHDDLPCMDDDDLRRGKPTCHKVYGECTAVLAGDALQAEAFHRLATSRRTQREGSNGQACAVLAQAAGPIQGICAGQYLDMNGEEKDEQTLYQIHSWKTAALLKAACLLGLVASPIAPSMAQWKAAKDYAHALGMAFQIRDDMLDEQSTTQQLGKPVGSDQENGKITFVSHYGLERCGELVEEYTQKAKEAVEQVFPHSEFLCILADVLAHRDH